MVTRAVVTIVTIVTMVTPSGRLPLHYACWSGSASCVTLFSVKSGFPESVAIADFVKWTPLHYAVLARSYEGVRLYFSTIIMINMVTMVTIHYPRLPNLHLKKYILIHLGTNLAEPQC